MNRDSQPPERRHPADEVRFRTFYADSYADVLRFVRRRTPPDRAEDVVAEAFLVAWRRVADLPAAYGDARAWVFGIARHCLLNDRRAAGRRAALAVRLADAAWPEQAPDPATDPQFVADRLDVAAAWPPTCAPNPATTPWTTASTAPCAASTSAASSPTPTRFVRRPASNASSPPRPYRPPTARPYAVPAGAAASPGWSLPRPPPDSSARSRSPP